MYRYNPLVGYRYRTVFERYFLCYGRCGIRYRTMRKILDFTVLDLDLDPDPGSRTANPEWVFNPFSNGSRVPNQYFWEYFGLKCQLAQFFALTYQKKNRPLLSPIIRFPRLVTYSYKTRKGLSANLGWGSFRRERWWAGWWAHEPRSWWRPSAQHCTPAPTDFSS